MVKVVKWYLSTFHAGRKSPVAKKPYNPILGELFQCWYSIPGVLSEDKVSFYLIEFIKFFDSKKKTNLEINENLFIY